MTIICNWCHKSDTVDNIVCQGDGTHGICLDCFLHRFPTLYELTYGDKTIEEVRHDISVP